MSTNSTYQINLQDIEADILRLENELASLKSLRDYVVRRYKFSDNTIQEHPHRQPENQHQDAIGFDSRASLELPVGLEISPFIIRLLKRWKELKTKDIVKAYAVYTGKEYADISNNINNTLVRLKDKKESIKAKPIEGERGSWWSLTTNGLHEADQ